jgi:hypothetical protein
MMVTALLVAVVAIGCGGQRNPGQDGPDSSGRPPTILISGEGLLPGDQRAPNGPTVTTAARRWPVGKAAVPPTTTTTLPR